MKTVFITGATAGIGEACAIKYAQNGYGLILNGRRKERLEELKASLEDEYGVSCYLLPFDVRDKEDVFCQVKMLPEEWRSIDILVNNAGLALGRDTFDEASMDDWEIMIDTNIKGLLYVSRAVLPYMIERQAGHIINLGSVAAKDMYDKGNVYCATKAAVEALSQTMRIELLPHHIKVTAIHPGAVETEFSLVRFKGDEETARKVYEGFQPLTGADIADVIYYCSSLPPHMCINDVVITPTQQANAIYFNKDGK
jgi:3-hydroxy acid dehydrogenase / malonic semialdehyde reductase